MVDIIYYYDKVNYKKHEIGYIQTDFNMSFVIDETKDSCKVVVHSYLEKPIEPMTIVYHTNINSWWVVAKDEIERIPNENTFIYIHTIQLLGAIELLNARDLTDCGFNQNEYTIEQAFFRLLKLSNLEFVGNPNITITLNNANNQIDTSKIIDYVKTFENYTLLSAVRDLFSAYNTTIKLEFGETVIQGEKYINQLNFTLHSKTGNGQVISEDYFNEVLEQKSMDSNNFATSIVSNAENVISTETKTYPTVGTIRLTGTSATITNNTARLRLPSTVFKVNWLKVCRKQRYHFNINANVIGFNPLDVDLFYEYQNPVYNNKEFNKLITYVNSLPSTYISPESKTIFIQYLNSIKQQLFAILDQASVTTLYNCERYDPNNDNFVAPDTPNFYFPIINKYYGADYTSQYTGKAVLTTKDIKDNAVNGYYCAIGWERDKDYIENFQLLGGADLQDHTRFVGYQSTDLRDSSYNNEHIFINETVVGIGFQQATFKVNLGNSDQLYARINNCLFVVNYVPMGDIKLYNQNGKLNDSINLSKMLLSHSKEVSSDTITKYAIAYDFDDIPKVGTIVNINNENYVINNVSLDFFQNESITSDGETHAYYIECQFTLSKNIAVKSLMTSPNTNIRDYGIPQNFNVFRKQLYRDFYELAHTRDTSADYDYLMTIDKILNVDYFYAPYQEHVAVMKIVYEDKFGGDEEYGIDKEDTWYYQLDTTTYMLKKSIYEVVNFKDNNIIGYSASNVSSAFDPARFMHGFTDMANTPVSYVDDNGRFKEIDIAFCSADSITDIYQNWQEYHNISENLVGASVFIDSEIFEGVTNEFVGANTDNDFMIIEEEYYKDALEVPVFEYSCQIDDSEDVIVGENILQTKREDKLYLYTYVLAPKNTINENNYISLTINTPSIGVMITQTNGVELKIEEDDNIYTLKIDLYEQTVYDLLRDTISQNNQVSLETIDFDTYDLVIIRNTIGVRNVVKSDLMFVIRNCDNLVTSGNTMELAINHYKIK